MRHYCALSGNPIRVYRVQDEKLLWEISFCKFAAGRKRCLSTSFGPGNWWGERSRRAIGGIAMALPSSSYLPFPSAAHTKGGGGEEGGGGLRKRWKERRRIRKEHSKRLMGKDRRGGFAARREQRPPSPPPSSSSPRLTLFPCVRTLYNPASLIAHPPFLGESSREGKN